MTSLQERQANRSLTLNAETAADLMTPNPLSIRQNATVKEAAAFLSDRGISAASVIDDAGRAVGVLSRADDGSDVLVGVISALDVLRRMQ